MISNRFGNEIVYSELKEDISISSQVEYLPLHAAYSYDSNLVIGNSFLYSRDFLYGSHNHVRGYHNLLSKFFNASYSTGYKYKIDDTDIELALIKGYLGEIDGTILICFGVKSSAIYDSNGFLGTQGVKNKNLKLFISNKFATDSKYRNVYKKMLKEIVQDCFLEGIEVVYMPSSKIKSTLYNSGVEYKFSTVTEAKEFLENEVHKIFTFEEDLYNVFSEVSLE